MSASVTLGAQALSMDFTNHCVNTRRSHANQGSKALVRNLLSLQLIANQGESMFWKLAALVGGAFLACVAPMKASAVAVNSTTIIRADFTATAPFDKYTIQVGYGYPNDDYPAGGEGHRFSLYDASDVLLVQKSLSLSNGTTSRNFIELEGPPLTSTFHVVLDNFVGEFDVGQITFFPWLSSTNFYDFRNGVNVGDFREQKFTISQVNQVPEPSSIALLVIAMGLIGLTQARRRKSPFLTACIARSGTA